MPNLWSTTTQKFFEAFQGPRTKDNYLIDKMEEIKRMQHGINLMKTTLENVKENSLGFKKIYFDLSKSLLNLFEKNSNFEKVLNLVVEINNDLINIHNDFNLNVSHLLYQASEWDEIYSKIKITFDEREEKRKKFDHYDEKIEKLIENKRNKILKKIPETNKDVELFDRVNII
jgi:uncharacterized coiled-coil DUF342 family protein